MRAGNHPYIYIKGNSLIDKAGLPPNNALPGVNVTESFQFDNVIKLKSAPVSKAYFYEEHTYK